MTEVIEIMFDANWSLTIREETKNLHLKSENRKKGIYSQLKF